jgi:hypothetical protein
MRTLAHKAGCNKNYEEYRMKKLSVLLASVSLVLLLAGCDLNKEEEKPPVDSAYQEIYSGSGTLPNTGSVFQELKLGSSSITIGSEKTPKVKTRGGGDIKATSLSIGKWDYVYTNGEKWGIVYHIDTGTSSIYIGKTAASTGQGGLTMLSLGAVKADITDIPDTGIPNFAGSYTTTAGQ